MSFRNRLPLILLVVSLTAMVSVGIGLFLWLDGVKETEARQLHGNLDNGAGRIQSEIALEFAVVAGLFSYAGEGAAKSKAFFPSLMELFPALHERWLAGTRFPGLIDAIFLVNRGKVGPALFRYADSEKRFIPHTGVASGLIKEVLALDEEPGSYRIVSQSDGLALVLPIEQYLLSDLLEKRKRLVHAGDIIILLDQEYFAKQVVDDLFAMYVGSRGRGYEFAVVADGSDELLSASSNTKTNGLDAILPRRVDRIVPLAAWISSENSLLSEVLSAADAESSALPQEVLTAQFKDLFIRQWYGLNRTRSPESASGGPASAAARPTEGADQSGGISLYIWHSEGSIEKAVRSVRNRRLAVGYAVLVCLMLIAVVYYLLYRRAKNLRDREHEFVTTVTHELRTPVSGVSAVADNLAEGIVSDPERVREYGRAILDHGRRLRDLIDQVLLYAGLSGSVKGVRSESIDLDGFIRAVASRVPSLSRDRAIIHVQPDLRRYSGDPLAIETIITNLLSNAAKHSGDTATVTLNLYRETWRRRSWLVIRVSDTGPGIPKRELARVLEPFYRGEESRARQIPGSGLGLSLVNRVVRTYRGRLSIDSTAGLGTIVTARLPFEQDRSDEG